MGKAALVYISLRRQYAALSTFSALFLLAVTESAVFMESAVSMSFAAQGWGKERWSFIKASVRSVRHFFRLPERNLQLRWNRQFRCRSQGVEGLGKGALVYISLRRQYAALGTFSACRNGIGSFDEIGSFDVVRRALKEWGKERWSTFL